MSIGDFNNITWVDEVTDLSKTNLQAMSNKISELDTELNYSRAYNWLNMVDYFYVRNQKILDYFQSGWSYDTGFSSTIGNDTTNFRIGTAGQRLTHTSSSSGWNVAYINISSVNALLTDNGDILTTSDYFVFYFYIYNASAVNSIQFGVGNSDSKFKYAHFASGFSTGWNCMYIKISDMSDSGSNIDLTTVTYLTFRWDCNASYSGCYVTGQLLTVQRNYSNLPCLLQEYNISAWTRISSALYALVLDTSDGYPKPNLICLENTIGNLLLLSSAGWNCFYAKVYFAIKLASNMPALTYYIDSNNYLSFYIDTSNYLTIKKCLSGSITYYTNAYTSLAINTKVLMLITKVNNIIRVICSNNGSVKILEIADPFPDSIGYFYLTNGIGYLRDFVVSNKSTLMLNSGSSIYY